MPKLGRYEGTRWVGVVNAHGADLTNVVARFVSSDGARRSVLLAKELAAGSELVVALDGQDVRARSCAIVATNGRDERINFGEASVASGDYFRWAAFALRRERRLDAFGRPQSIGGPARQPQSLNVRPPTGADDAADSASGAIASTPQASVFAEIVNFSGSPIDVKTIAFSIQGSPISIDAGLVLQPGDFVDIDFRGDGDIQLTGCKIRYRMGRQERVDGIPFDLVEWCVYVSVGVVGVDPWPLQWAGRGGRLDAESAAPLVAVGN